MTISAFPVGAIWRDANVRSGASVSCSILQLLLPDGTEYRAEGWARGEKVVEGSIISDIWLRLAPGRWCSAVNFDQTVMASLPASAELAGPVA